MLYHSVMSVSVCIRSKRGRCVCRSVCKHDTHSLMSVSVCVSVYGGGWMHIIMLMYVCTHCTTHGVFLDENVDRYQVLPHVLICHLSLHVTHPPLHVLNSTEKLLLFTCLSQLLTSVLRSVGIFPYNTYYCIKGRTF